MDPGARAAPLVAWLWPVLLAPEPEAPLPPTPEPLPVLEMVAEPAQCITAISASAHDTIHKTVKQHEKYWLRQVRTRCC